MKQHKYTRFPKGVLLKGKRGRFGLQKESFYNAKGALLTGKRAPFEMGILKKLLSGKTNNVVKDGLKAQ